MEPEGGAVPNPVFIPAPHFLIERILFKFHFMDTGYCPKRERSAMTEELLRDADAYEVLYRERALQEKRERESKTAEQRAAEEQARQNALRAEQVRTEVDEWLNDQRKNQESKNMFHIENASRKHLRAEDLKCPLCKSDRKSTRPLLSNGQPCQHKWHEIEYSDNSAPGVAKLPEGSSNRYRSEF
jgi:hypothetical protein